MPGAHVQLQYNEVFSTNGFQQIGFKIDQHEPGLSSGHGTELKSPKRIQNRCTKAFAEPIWKSWKCQPKPKYFEQIYLDLRPYQEELPGKLPTNSKLLSELMKSP